MRRKLMAALFVVASAVPVFAGDIALRLNVGTNGPRVTVTVVVGNATDQTINLMPNLSKGTNWTSSALLWRVNDEPAEFFPKRALLMYPPFDTKVLPPHSTNAVALVEDDELFILTQTTNAHTRVGRPALPSTGQYNVEVRTTVDWGGHPDRSASAIVDIEKTPTSTRTLRR